MLPMAPAAGIGRTNQSLDGRVLAVDVIEQARRHLVAGRGAHWLALGRSCQAIACISRAIVQRAMDTPSRIICRYILRRPWTMKALANTRATLKNWTCLRSMRRDEREVEPRAKHVEQDQPGTLQTSGCTSP